ncbi:MAG: hydroxymethylglutaryl-CoA lyase [Chloroflexota bacterium]
MMDSNPFKRAMSQFASGVTVITAVYQNKPIGVTATAFSSLSLDPPLILVNLNKKLFTHKVISDTGVFGVNFLTQSQQERGMVFAGMRPEIEERFAGVPTQTAVTGCPVFSDALAWLDCTVWAAYDGGDHTIFVGEVKDCHAVEQGEPLLYHNRHWLRAAPLNELSLPKTAEIYEVGPRDGLQTQKKLVPTEMKVAAIRQAAEAGIKRIQVTSFVHPRLVPQMADAEDVCAQLPEIDGVQYNGLVLNMRGLQRAHKAGLKYVDMGVPASETLSQKNANSSIEEGMARMEAMVKQAREWGMGVRAGVQTAFGCVYEGEIPQERVVDLTRRFLAMGIDELSLADSAGLGNPDQMRRMVEIIRPLANGIPIVLHLHDTRGMGLANCMAAIDAGITRFDSSFGGLGGCPFIKGAKGNIPTEDTLHMMHEMGIETSVDIGKVATISRQFEQFFDRELPGKIYALEA